MVIEIGTRSSPLALWQANTVSEKLKEVGHESRLIPIESTGDLGLAKPIYELGVTGVFTRELDETLLQSRIRIAVHSLKDVPTKLAQGICLGGVLQRGPSGDVLICKIPLTDIVNDQLGVATSSIRRRAQWLSKYPGQTLLPIRGNVHTRLKKFQEDSTMQGIIFAKAGLERAGLLPPDHYDLDWMIPAPAQGIIGIMCREDDDEMKEILSLLNHYPTFQAGKIERDFMRGLLGGCSVPISAEAVFTTNESIHFKGAMHDPDGSQFNRIEEFIHKSEWNDIGSFMANKLLKQPQARELLNKIRDSNYKE